MWREALTVDLALMRAREWMIRPGMLPGLVEAAVDGVGQNPRRTLRDWVVDGACLLLAAAMAWISLSVASPALISLPLAVTVIAAVLACAALFFRRRYPVALTVVLIVASVVIPAVSGASMIGLFTAAVHRRLPTVLLLVALAAVSAMAQFSVMLSIGSAEYGLAVGGTILLSLLVVGWGIAVRGRRELVLLMAERMRRAQVEQESRLREARGAVREGIARDLHDSLAHRLSLISMTAGALDYRASVPAQDLDEMVDILRWNARQGMSELRQVVTVLRRPDGHAVSGQHHPGAVLDLVGEARASGQEVELVWSIPVADVSRSVGDSLYRCVQEGLSNARKHAGGRPVTVTGRVDEEGTIAVIITNPLDHGAAPDGSWSGLHGLRERVIDARGRLTAAVIGDVFQLQVEWPSVTARRGADD